jgi:hypothetical protein
VTPSAKVEEQAARSEAVPPFLPVGMLNEFTYCARPGYLEWVQGKFTDNDDTVEGRYHHYNVDHTRQRPAERRQQPRDPEDPRAPGVGQVRHALPERQDRLPRERRAAGDADPQQARQATARSAKRLRAQLVQLSAQGLPGRTTPMRATKASFVRGFTGAAQDRLRRRGRRVAPAPRFLHWRSPARGSHRPRAGHDLGQCP